VAAQANPPATLSEIRNCIGIGPTGEGMNREVEISRGARTPSAQNFGADAALQRPLEI